MMKEIYLKKPLLLLENHLKKKRLACFDHCRSSSGLKTNRQSEHPYMVSTTKGNHVITMILQNIMKGKTQTQRNLYTLSMKSTSRF